MRVKVWGARGSVPAPGPEMNRYGGNTSCVEVTLSSGETLILDAGTGIRTLGFSLPPEMPRINILLTHLHLDHIQGLMFFPPCFRAESTIRIWGPSSPEATLEARIARYISAPLSPVEVRELPCDVSFLDAPASEWKIGNATIRAEAVTHRGPTLGYRITDGDTTLCYIPDHEPALGARWTNLDPEWISGYNLARDADLLIHDCQYTDEEYPGHEGWGHSRVSDTITFAQRVGAKRTLLFHHDPLHTDGFLDDLHLQRPRALGRSSAATPAQIEIACERCELIVEPVPRLPDNRGPGRRHVEARLQAETGRAWRVRAGRVVHPSNRLSKRFRSADVTATAVQAPRRRIFDAGTNTGRPRRRTLMRVGNRDRRSPLSGVKEETDMAKRLSLAALLALVACLGAARRAGGRPGHRRSERTQRRHHVGDRRRVLVLFMQAGFLFLEIGFSRQKNVGAGVAKILVNLGIATLAWWAVGYGIAGFGNDFFGHRRVPRSSSTRTSAECSVGGADTAADAVRDVVLRVSLAIVWGTTLERIKFSAYVIYAIDLRGGDLPAGLARRLRWRSAVRQRRQAGDGLRRIDGRPPDGRGRRPGGVAAARPAHRQVRSRRQATRDPGALDADRRPRRADPLGRLVRVQRRLDVRHRRRRAASPQVALNTQLAAAAGALARDGDHVLRRRKTIDVGMAGNGAIAGLVAITAPSGYVEFWARRSSARSPA